MGWGENKMAAIGQVLVTGATGFIGFEVARQLSKRGFKPRLLVRRPLRAALLASLEAELIQGDLERPPTLYTPDAVLGWNLNGHVKRGLLWNELEITPNYPTLYQGIPAVLDDCVAFRWIHPVADRIG